MGLAYRIYFDTYTRFHNQYQSFVCKWKHHISALNKTVIEYWNLVVLAWWALLLLNAPSGPATSAVEPDTWSTPVFEPDAGIWQWCQIPLDLILLLISSWSCYFSWERLAHIITKPATKKSIATTISEALSELRQQSRPHYHLASPSGQKCAAAESSSNGSAPWCRALSNLAQAKNEGSMLPSYSLLQATDRMCSLYILSRMTS